jgi:hypothetical protein
MGNTRKIRKGTKKNVKRGKKDRKSKKMRGGVTYQAQKEVRRSGLAQSSRNIKVAFLKHAKGNVNYPSNHSKFNYLKNDHLPVEFSNMRLNSDKYYSLTYTDVEIENKYKCKEVKYFYNGKEKIRLFLYPNISPMELNDPSIKKYIEKNGYSFKQKYPRYAATLNLTQAKAEAVAEDGDEAIAEDGDEAVAEDGDEAVAEDGDDAMNDY